VLVAVGVVATGVIGALVVLVSGDGTNMAHAVMCQRTPCSNRWSGDINGGAFGMGPYGNGNWATPGPSTGGLPPNVPPF
jgi:hypothetical protein